MRRLPAIPLIALGLLVAAVAGCGGSASPTSSGSSPADGLPTPDPGALRVVATTTVFADLVRQVGGVHVAVTSLVPKGGEVHTFDPSPGDVGRLTDAGLIVMNGLGLDDWLGSLATDAGARAPIVRLSEDLPGVTYLGGGAPNPHLWLNVTYATALVERIRGALDGADPAHAAAFDAGAVAYVGRLRDLDAWVRARIGSVPPPDRRIVSFHDAFPYFAAAYGLQVVGVVVPAPGQEPSAGQVAALIDAIRASGVRAVLAEAQFNDRLARTIAAEAGATVVSDLYTDTLGDPPVDTYEGLIRWDTERIVAALAR